MSNNLIWTPDAEARFLAQIELGSSITGAAIAVGLAGRTARRRFQEDQAWRSRVLEAREGGIHTLEDKLLGKTNLDNMAGVVSTLALLKANAPARWTDRGQAQAIGMRDIPTLKIVIDRPELAPPLGIVVEASSVRQLESPEDSAGQDGSSYNPRS